MYWWGPGNVWPCCSCNGTDVKCEEIREDKDALKNWTINSCMYVLKYVITLISRHDMYFEYFEDFSFQIKYGNGKQLICLIIK